MHDTLQYHIYVRRKFHGSVACYKFTTYCTQIQKHLYSESTRHGLSCCIYIRTKFALLSASLNDKLYSRHFPSCFFNSWVRGVQQAKTMRQREANGSSATKKKVPRFSRTIMLITTFVRFCSQLPSKANQLQSTLSKIQCRLKTYTQSFQVVFFRFNTPPPKKNCKIFTLVPRILHALPNDTILDPYYLQNICRKVCYCSRLAIMPVSPVFCLFF